MVQIESFKAQFSAGSVFAYPTEAVYGLGCDPLNENAMNEILRLKHRPVEKGVILIASSVEQLQGFVCFDNLPKATTDNIKASWPGPHTWLVSKGSKTPEWICGGSDLVAVRVTTHPLVRAMCDAVDSPLVSTSANPSGLAPARSAAEIKAYFGEEVVLLDGQLGEQQNPSTITNAITLERIR